MPAARRSQLEVGSIDRPHGLAGAVVVTLVTDQLERLAPAATLSTDAGSARRCARRGRSRHRFVVTFEGVDTLEAAESLRGTVLRGDPISKDGALWVDAAHRRRRSARRTAPRSASSPASRRTPRATCWCSTPGRSSPRDSSSGLHRRRRRHRRAPRGTPLMRIDVYTIFPELIDRYAAESILGRARASRRRGPARARPARARERRSPHGRRHALRRRRGHGARARPDLRRRRVRRGDRRRRAARCSPSRRRGAGSTSPSRASSPPSTASRCCAGATRASTSACSTTAATAS